MFAQSDVDALFADTARTLRRSQFMLDERSRGPPPDAPTVLPRTPLFAAALRDLRALTDLSAYLDASEAVGRRLAAESRAPSGGVARRRLRGSQCPLLRGVADGVARLDASGARGALWDGAAAVAAALLLAGVCADWRHARPAPEAWPAGAEERGEGRDSAAEGLAIARAALPDDAADELEARVVRVAAEVRGGGGPGALLSVPSLLAHIVRRAAPALAAQCVVGPLRSAAAALPAAHSADAAEFRAAAARLAQTAASLIAHAGSGAASGPHTNCEARRAAAFARDVVDAYLEPLERFFAAAPVRTGAALDVHAAVAAPLRTLAPRVAQYAPALGGIWCTACYRALLVVETLASAEIGVLSGKGNAAAQQKRYESMLRHSNGRVTAALLATVTEDRELLFEETTARSAQGHRVYRIHAGEEPGRGAAVFLYVDDGTVFLKIGREKAYRRAKSVEDVFAIFNSPDTL